MATKKQKKKLAPGPKPKPTKVDGGMEMANNEFVSELLASPYMKANPLAKLGLFDLLPDKQTPIPVKGEDLGRGPTGIAGKYVLESSGKPIKYNFGSPIQKKNMVPIRTPDGSVMYRYPQDLERVYEEDTIYTNVNPKTLSRAAIEMDKIRGVPKGTTSKTQGQIDTIIHELIHRGFLKVDSLKDTSHEGQHDYIAEKQKGYLNPTDGSTPYRLKRKYYETLIDSDPKAKEYIKTHMPELSFRSTRGYEEDTKPIGIMTKLLRHLMK